MSSLNKNNSAVKRIMQEARELANDTSTDYTAAPLEDDIFEWHCTLRGPLGTDYEGGLYHFRITLPSEYPFRPPSIMMLTPNGRFELNTKICISFTNYHEELWQPAWGVRTAIVGLQGFFPLSGQVAAGIGAVEYPSAERKRLAQKSREWVCPRCQKSNLDCLPDPSDPVSSTASSSTNPVSSGGAPSSDDSRQATANADLEVSRGQLTSPTTNHQSRPASDVVQDVAENITLAPQNAIPLSDVSTAPPGVSGRETLLCQPALSSFTRSFRPPLLLDAAISILLVAVLALLCHRVL